MKTLKEVVEAQGMSTRAFVEKAGISLHTIGNIMSGEWDRAMLSNNGRSYSGRKRFGAIQTMARVLIACDVDPREWVKAVALHLTNKEERVMHDATVNRRPKLIITSGFGSEEWNSLLAIANNPLTKDDLEQLTKAQEALGDLFTIKLAIEVLIGKYKKNSS